MAIDAQWSSVVLLCPFEGADGSTTITDVKGHVVTVAGNAQISTAQYPAGCSSSAKFDGNNDYLTISHADLALGTGDFDIDFPLYKAGETTTGAGNAGTLIDFRTAEPSVAIGLFVDGGSGSTGANKVYLYVNGANRIVGTTEIGAAFKRVTLSRVSGVTRLFIDGVQEGSSYTDTNNYTQTVANIGGRFAATSGDYRSLNGYIGPIRITKHGRGHSTTFTPDSLPFPRPTISGTVLDHLAAPVARPVVAVDRKTSQVLSGTISDAITGAYTIYPRTFGEVTVARYDELFDPVTDECLFDLLPIYPRPGPSLVWGVVDTRSHIVSPAGNANFPDCRQFHSMAAETMLIRQALITRCAQTTCQSSFGIVLSTEGTVRRGRAYFKSAQTTQTGQLFVIVKTQTARQSFLFSFTQDRGLLLFRLLRH
jgi:hypothetical protein